MNCFKIRIKQEYGKMKMIFWSIFFIRCYLASYEDDYCKLMKSFGNPNEFMEFLGSAIQSKHLIIEHYDNAYQNLTITTVNFHLDIGII